MANKTDDPEIKPWEMTAPHPPAGATRAENARIAEITRHSFRGPVSDADQITLEINGRHYQVVDIGSHGIGIALPDNTTLAKGERCAVNLLLQGQRLALQGAVKHISEDAEAGLFHCGIELLDLSREAEQQLQAFVLRQRHSLFARKD